MREVPPVADGSENDFYAILGRALVDSRFRERLRDDNDRVAALSEVGITLNDEQLGQLNENIDNVDELAHIFAGQQAAAAT
jgi:hypothetical protein